MKYMFHLRMNEFFPEISTFFILFINFGIVEVKKRLASDC